MDLTYERRGSGPPLVLLHGIGHHWQGWLPVLDLLARERDVIAVDLPGFGESPPLPDGTPYTLRTLSDAVEGFCAELGLQQPHVAGNSLGGLIALELAARGSVCSATALSPAGFWRPPEGRWAQTVLRTLRFLARHTPAGVTARLARSTAGRVVSHGMIFGHPTRIDPEEAVAAAGALVNCPGFDETLRAIAASELPAEPKVPVTIAWGTRDLILPPWQARRAARWEPRAQAVRLPGCGHVPMSDEPELVAKTLLAGSS